MRIQLSGLDNNMKEALKAAGIDIDQFWTR